MLYFALRVEREWRDRPVAPAEAYHEVTGGVCAYFRGLMVGGVSRKSNETADSSGENGSE